MLKCEGGGVRPQSGETRQLAHILVQRCPLLNYKLVNGSINGPVKIGKFRYLNWLTYPNLKDFKEEIETIGTKFFFV